MPSPTQILQTVAFLDLLAAGLIVPQLPPHARVLGCNHVLIGIMVALYSGFQLLCGPMTRTLYELKNRKGVLLLAISLSGIAYVLLGITSSIVLFLGLRAFLGVFKQTQVLTKALIPEYEKDENQLKVLNGRIETLSAIGMCLAPIIGGHVMEMFPQYGFTLIALTVGAIFGVNSGLIRRLPNEEKKEKEKTKIKDKEVADDIASKLVESVVHSIKQSIEQVFKIDWNIHGEVFLLKLLQTFCMGVYFCNFAVFLKFKLDATPVDLGYVASFLWTVGAFFTYFIDYINKLYKDDKDFSIRNYHVFLTLTLSLTGMALAPSISWYAYCLVPLAVSSNFGRIVGLEIILTKTNASQKGDVVGVANSIRNVCGVIAPLIAGVVSHYIGMLNIIYLCILLAAIGTYRSYKLISEIVVKSKSE